MDSSPAETVRASVGAGVTTETPTTRRGGRMRRWAAAAAIALLGVGLLPAQAGADDQSDAAAFVSKINALRASQGLAVLAVDAQLTAKAQAWSKTMADKGDIWHSN